MEFPALMPKELSFYEKSSSEEFLYAALIKNPHDVVLFFETASDDETWASNHEELMKKLLEWLTAQTLSDRLSKRHYQQVSYAIQKHYLIFKSYLPKNILIKLKDADIPFNSLLLFGASDFFKQILLNESRGQEANSLTFPQLNEKAFASIGSFISTGDVPDLSTKGPDEIIDLIKRANAWEISSLSVMCERMLLKYVSKENVFEMLTKAKSERWAYFEQACLHFVNEQGWGFRLSSVSFERLAFEFLDFYEHTIDFFEQLRPMVTDIICGKELVEQPQFGLILKECPHLFLLDISRTSAYSNQYEEISKGLQALNLSECPWLSKDTLKRFFELCPHLTQLTLQNDVQLNHFFWSELVKFKELKVLDVSQCNQLQEMDLSLFLKGLNALTELSLSNCKKIGEVGFLEMAKSLPRLIRLNLSRCSVSDTALVEIAARCRNLTALNISGCDQLTEKGILALIKQTTSLQELDISRCRISVKTVEEIQKISPQLNLKV